MSSKKIALINYKIGNVKSDYNAFKFLGFDIEITDNKQKLKSSSWIVLPGVGAFGDTMKNLDASGLTVLLKKEIARNKPYLGICLGYQVLFEESEEAPGVKGLGIFKGKVIRFKTKKLKVPHIGWNSITKQGAPICLEDVSDGSFFYFVHSYYPVPEDKSIIATNTEYGKIFASSISRDNLFASQFHPEKSQDNGLKIIKNFGDKCVNNTGN